MTRSCSNARAERLIDEFEEASALDRGGFSVRHGIAAVLRHIADTEGDAESWYAIPASTLVQLAAALTPPSLLERAMAPPTNSITFQEGSEVIRIDAKGFHYHGQFIEDAGEAHRLLVEYLRKHQPDSDWRHAE